MLYSRKSRQIITKVTFLVIFFYFFCTFQKNMLPLQQIFNLNRKKLSLVALPNMLTKTLLIYVLAEHYG